MLITTKSLIIGACSDCQKELLDKVIRLRDTNELTFKGIAEKLISEGYRSPRGFDLGPESVFSIYKKRKRRDLRLQSPPEVEISNITTEQIP